MVTVLMKKSIFVWLQYLGSREHFEKKVDENYRRIPCISCLNF